MQILLDVSDVILHYLELYGQREKSFHYATISIVDTNIIGIVESKGPKQRERTKPLFCSHPPKKKFQKTKCIQSSSLSTVACGGRVNYKPV